MRNDLGAVGEHVLNLRFGGGLAGFHPAQYFGYSLIISGDSNPTDVEHGLFGCDGEGEAELLQPFFGLRDAAELEVALVALSGFQLPLLGNEFHDFGGDPALRTLDGRRKTEEIVFRGCGR